MKLATGSSAFLSPSRTFNWQTSHEVNHGPLVVAGHFVKHRPNSHAAEWNGMSLKPTFEDSPTPSQKKRSYAEFLSAKRTIDPSYPDKPVKNTSSKAVRNRPASVGNLQDMISQADTFSDFGKGFRGATINGKVVKPNATSNDNTLRSNGEGQHSNHRWNGEKQQEERRSKKSNLIAEQKKESQITTLPGPNYSPAAPSRIRNDPIKPDFQSHIHDLPGTLKLREEPVIMYKPLNKVERNTFTSDETEDIFGAPAARTGPRTRVDSPTSKPKEEEDFSRTGKHFLKPAYNRMMRESKKEVAQVPKQLKGRSERVRDMFSSNFTLG